MDERTGTNAGPAPWPEPNAARYVADCAGPYDLISAQVDPLYEPHQPAGGPWRLPRHWWRGRGPG